MAPAFRAAAELGGPVVREEVLDGLTEALMMAGCPLDRAAVVSTVVLELYAALEWLQGNDAGTAELAGVHTVVLTKQDGT